MSHTTTVTWPTSEIITPAILKQKLAEHPVDTTRLMLANRKTGPHPADPRWTVDTCTWVEIAPLTPAADQASA